MAALKDLEIHKVFPRFFALPSAIWARESEYFGYLVQLLSFNGDLIYFNFRNKIEADAWGDFMVGGICAVKEGVFELVLAAQPVRKGKGV